MSVRLYCCLALILAGGAPHAVWAQPSPWNRTGTLNLEVPISHANSPGDPFGATTHPTWDANPIASQGRWWNDTVDGDFHSYGQPGHGGYPDSYGYPPGAPGPYGPGGGGVGYAPDFTPQFQFAPADTGPYGGPQPRTRYELLPEDRGFLYDEDIARLQLLRRQMNKAWFRMEYLNYSMRNPGNTLLGAPISGIDNPREPFFVNSLDSTGNLVTVGSARVMDMSPIDLAHLNGARISFGVPTQRGEFEGVFWGTDTVERFRAPELTRAGPLSSRIPPLDLNYVFLNSSRAAPISDLDKQNPNAVFIATSLLDNGEPGNLLILYDADFSAKYNLKTWGSEANMYWDLRDPVDGWSFRALTGFRYTSHDEELIQHGAFSNISSLDQPIPFPPTISSIVPTTANVIDPPVINTIYSRTNNDVFAGQIGFKTELETRWVTVGVTPKVSLGANTYSAVVQTQDLRTSPDIRGSTDSTTSVLGPAHEDGPVLTRLEKTHWSPGFDLGVYARLNVTDWASVQVGYNFLWMHNIARADDVLYYNDRGLANPAAVVVQPSREDFWMQGISIGGQLTLPK